MGTFWYSLILYILGVSLILLVRPAFMFHPDGTWKEFGMSNTAGHTMFPVWMFALVWAILSFAGANLIQIFLASTVLQSLPAPMPSHEAILQPISNNPNVMPAPVMPPVTPNLTFGNLQSAMNKVPGYYVMDRMIQPEPRYIYWGPEPPTATDLQGLRTNA
jgi:hypothetical protein